MMKETRMELRGIAWPGLTFLGSSFSFFYWLGDGNGGVWGWREGRRAEGQKGRRAEGKKGKRGEGEKEKDVRS